MSGWAAERQHHCVGEGESRLSTRTTARFRRAIPQAFVVYYGRGPLPGVDCFPLAILEPRGWSTADLADLRTRGVATLAYCSGLEASEEIYREAGLGTADVLRCQGQPWHKAQWGTWVVDPRSARWRAFVLARVTALMRAGWQGVFVDTLGDIEDVAVAEHRAWLAPAAAELVYKIRTTLGGARLVQNHGLHLLFPLVAQHLDGICWEAPPLSAFGHSDWADQTLERVLTVGWRNDMMVLLLDRAPSDAFGETVAAALSGFAARHGCIAYTAPDDYHLGIRLPDGRVEPAPRSH